MFRWLYLFPHRSLLSIPAVIAWLESMTRLESQFLVTRTRLESHWEKLSLDSSHVFHKMTRLESRFSQNDSTRITVNDSRLESESFFAKRRSSWSTNPVRLHTKKWAFVASVMTKIGGNRVVWKAVAPPKKNPDAKQSFNISKHLGRCVLFRASCELAPWVDLFQNLTKLN